jgi:putative FmdB family regulatory protein
MPVYEYLCKNCGPFIRTRAMAEYELPSDCPQCGARAPRVLLTAPQCLDMSPQSRRAHAANERSADAPAVRSSLQAAHKAAHGAGCGCCATSNSKLRHKSAASHKSAARSFPSRRPWMLSH